MHKMSTVLRYLSREKFEWLLSDKGIFVAPASGQSDKLEGIYDYDWLIRGLKKRIPSINQELCKEISSLNHDIMHLHREHTFLSSWYSGHEETLEMWCQYGKDGVVLVSSVFSLINSTPEPLTQVAEYAYITYSDTEKRLAVFNPFKYKNEEFKYESEFRMIFDISRYSILTGFEKEKYGEVFIGFDRTPSYQSEEIIVCMSNEGISKSHDVICRKSNGYVISYDLNKVINEIRISPYCTDDDEDYFRQMLIKAGIQSNVSRSNLLKQHT